jgi:hypothetical protein
LRLVVNGCSHTAGAELEYACQSVCYDKAWGSHLSGKLGYDYTNLSESGASCDRVTRTTYEFIYDYIKFKGNIKDVLFIVLWPGTYRTELYHKHAQYGPSWRAMVTGNDEQYKNDFSDITYRYYQAWVAATTKHQHCYNYLTNVLNLQNLFKRYKLPYLFVDSANIGGEIYDDDLKYLKMHIDRKYYFGFEDELLSYTAWCSDNNLNISEYSIDSGFNSHYDEDAHKAYSDFLYVMLKDRKLI